MSKRSVLLEELSQQDLVEILQQLLWRLNLVVVETRGYGEREVTLMSEEEYKKETE